MLIFFFIAWLAVGAAAVEQPAFPARDGPSMPPSAVLEVKSAQVGGTCQLTTKRG